MSMKYSFLGIDDSFIYIKHSCVIHFLNIEVKCQGLSVNIKINFLNTCFFISLGHLFGKVRQMHKKVHDNTFQMKMWLIASKKLRKLLK